MAKELLFGKAAKDKLLAGTKKLAMAVGDTLGPLGNNVAIEQKWGVPRVIHDGVKVAKEIVLTDPFENIGAQLVKDAAEKTNDTAGDGTTTAIVLAEALIEDGLKLIRSGVNARKLRKGMEIACGYVVEMVRKKSKKIKNDSEIEQIASLSAQDEEIGKIVAKAIKITGKTGVVAVDEGKGAELSIDFKEGMEFDKGYLSPYFVNQVASEPLCALTDPYVLVTDKIITQAKEILPFINLVLGKGSKSFVIIAEDVQAEALATLVVNKLQGVFMPLAVKIPGWGDMKPEMLEDIAVVCGATVISSATGKSLENITIDDLGKADLIESTKSNTRIIGGKGETIEVRVQEIQTQIDRASSEFEKEKLQERLAKLDSGVAVINVGAQTETALQERREMVNDAVAAAKAAISNGVVAGGGTTLLRIGEEFGDIEKKDKEVEAGINLVRDSLQKPFTKLMKNSGIKPDQSDIMEIFDTDNFGIDVTTGEKKDLIKAGIIDATLVVTQSVQNAISVAGTILTTNVLIGPEEGEEKNDSK